MIAETRPQARAPEPLASTPLSAETAAVAEVARSHAAPVAEPTLLRDLAVLTKLRLSSLVLVTTALGYLDAGAAVRSWPGFVATLIGTALAAFGANALNQWAERDLDARMRRTRGRPLPAGRLSSRLARDLGIGLAVSGVALLYALANPLAASLAALSVVSYVLLYTPAKRHTPHSTLLGAVPGALPPVIGYAAAAGGLDLNAAFLFAVLFFWQLPHFYAISWLWRDDYARAGYPMLAVIDAADGRRTANHAVFHLAALFGLSLAPVAFGASLFYGVAALAFGGVFLHAGIAFRRERSESNARRLFVWSLLYLPALLMALVKDVL